MYPSLETWCSLNNSLEIFTGPSAVSHEPSSVHWWAHVVSEGQMAVVWVRGLEEAGSDGRVGLYRYDYGEIRG